MGVVEDWVSSYNTRDWRRLSSCLSADDFERIAYAQLVEHYEHDGEVRDTPEIIVFGLDGDGRVRRMRLYLQRPGGQAPVGGKDAMGATSTS